MSPAGLDRETGVPPKLIRPIAGGRTRASHGHTSPILHSLCPSECRFEIMGHRQETIPQTEKTNFNLSLEDEAMRIHHQGTSANLPRIVDWITAKKLNEYELARRILFEFDKPALLGPLRGWVGQALQEMDDLRRADLEGQQILNLAWNEEKNKNNNTVVHYVNLSALARDVGKLSAKQCGDVIRLYGVVVEKGGAKYRAKLKAYQSRAVRYLPFDAGVTGPYGAQLHQQEALRKFREKLVWSKDPENLARARAEVRPQSCQPTSPGRAQQKFLELGGGINAWTLLDGSTVHKMDRLFGLSLGADISGTTADTIAFLRRFVAAGVDPVYYLLPIATIVAAGHHTILEAGLALTHNWQLTSVEYRIGFYTTLIPPGAEGEAAMHLRGVLQQYQDDRRNRLLLIYYAGPDRVGGCYEYVAPQDRDTFRRMALADVFLMMRVRSSFSSPWLSKDDLDGFERGGWALR